MKNSLQLRKVEEGDIAIFFEQQLDPDAIEMGRFPGRPRDVFFAQWQKIMNGSALLSKTIISLGKVAGNIVYWEQDNELNVGYWLGKEFWGKSIATFALSQSLPEISTRPIFARVAGSNLASLRVLEKCGFTVSGEDTFPWNDGNKEKEFIMRLGESPEHLNRNENKKETLIDAESLHWRPSNLMAIPNADFLERTGSEMLGARLWSLPPKSANTLHRHITSEEFFFVLEGTGRIRVDGKVYTVRKHEGIHVWPHQMRQVFNDTEAEVLWLITGSPDNEMAGEKPDLSKIYPSDPKELPAELGDVRWPPNKQDTDPHT